MKNTGWGSKKQARGAGGREEGGERESWRKIEWIKPGPQNCCLWRGGGQKIKENLEEEEKRREGASRLFIIIKTRLKGWAGKISVGCVKA